MLYVGPTEKNVRSMSLDRATKMIRSTPALADSLLAGIHDKVTEKWIGGARLGFAWASSATELASHPAFAALVDERDRMADDINGEGDPVTIVRARLKNYAGSKLLITSSPTIEGVSATWAHWESGTMGIWSWECPECDGWFGPRSELLVFDEDAELSVIEATAAVRCPHCASLIGDEKKRLITQGPVYHEAPGDEPMKPLNPSLEPKESSTYSLWVNGLCSRFPGGRIGILASHLQEARRSRNPLSVQACLNTDFGELYRVTGDRPLWQEVEACKGTYRKGDVPDGVQVLVMSIDVQRDRLYWVVRGFGHNLESWGVAHGMVLGSTDFDDAWIVVSNIMQTNYGNLPIRVCLIDSGYKPGSEYRRPENVIYQFCARHGGIAYPSKGHATFRTPVTVTPLKREGTQLVQFDTDHFKTSLQVRIRWPQNEPGAWHCHREIDEDYCRQVTAEEVVITPGGKRAWVDHGRPNHYGDCEVLCLVAARMLSLEALPEPGPARQRELAAIARQFEAPMRPGRFERFD